MPLPENGVVRDVNTAPGCGDFQAVVYALKPAQLGTASLKFVEAVFLEVPGDDVVIPDFRPIG